MTKTCLPGPLMIDVAGTELSDEDIELIAHPRVGGIILFTRNYQNRQQLQQLVRDIRAARSGPLLIAVDHEGGRVQRFREGFTRIPPMRQFGELFDTSPDQARISARKVACVLAWELRQCGIDFSFAPVLDIDQANSSVIGDRSFHARSDAVVALATCVIEGFNDAGCASVAKHFPGHGSVSADTHAEMARDDRSFAEIDTMDMQPFRQLAAAATAVMPAHVIYSSCDAEPASLSSFWQKQILRGSLGFNGPIISDDLSMSAITLHSTQAQAAAQALRAGTDLALICNDRPAVLAAVAYPDWPTGLDDSVQRRQLLQARDVDAPAEAIIAAGRRIAESLAG